MADSSSKPVAKRPKLEHDSPIYVRGDSEEAEETAPTMDLTADDVELQLSPDNEGENNCVICLEPLIDRTVIPKCSHEFCFECLLVWTEQSRRCPLCQQSIEGYLIHSIRSRYDYRKHYLAPLRTSPKPPRPAQSSSILLNTRNYARRRRREREWVARDGEDENDKLERSILKRRWIYEHDLYAKHVASNSFTKYRPYPTPAQFAASQDLISRTTTFLRRELQVWEGLDVEFLTTLIISLMKSIDIRSESAVKLIAEFLDMDAPYEPGARQTNAEHFAHEVYCYVRSPYKDLFVYDSVAQYEAPPGVEPPPDLERGRRWRPSSPVRQERATDGAGPSRRQSSRSSERSNSWSPSGRHYSPVRPREASSRWSPPRASTSRKTGHKNRHRSSHSPVPSEDAFTRLSKRKNPQEDADDANGRSYSSARVRQPAASSSHITDSSQYFSSHAKKTHLKGKGRATSTTPEDASPFAEEAVDGGHHGLDRSTTPTNQNSPKHNVNTVTRQPSGSVRALKPPRNRTLLESVKAHLDRRPGSSSSTLPNLASSTKKHGEDHDAGDTANSAGGLEQQGHTEDSSQHDPAGDRLLTSSATQGDAIGVKKYSLHATGVTKSTSPANVARKDDANKIGDRSLTSQIRRILEPTEHKLQSGLRVRPPPTNTANSRPQSLEDAKIDMTLLPASIPGEICAAGTTKMTGKDATHTVRPTTPLPAGFALHQGLAASSASVDDRRLPISDALQDDRSQTPVENTPNTITVDAHAHTRLLTRLKLEKAQAKLSARQSNMDGLAHAQSGADTSARRGSDNGCHAPTSLSSTGAACYSANANGGTVEAQVHGGLDVSDAPVDFDEERKTLVSLNTQQRGGNDPDSASEGVARVKEAELKAKLRAAHLRARLTAEKRTGGR